MKVHHSIRFLLVKKGCIWYNKSVIISGRGNGVQVTVQKAALQGFKRVLITSDIHGHVHLLKRLLDEAAFCDEDALIIVGDLVEKGPSSLDTIRYVMQLNEKPNVFPLMGNVDLWRLCLLEKDDPENQKEVMRFSRTAVQWWGSSIVTEMMDELGLDPEQDGKQPGLFKRLRSCFAKELDFIRNLPIVLETESFHFVHGGLPHERMDELKKENPFALLKNDDFLNKGLSFEKWVLVGHWPVALYNDTFLQHGPVIEKDRHIIAIDGGCGVRGDGQLNLLITDWEGKRFSHLSAMDKPMIKVLNAQQPSAYSHNIPYHDPVVELIKREENWALVRHHMYEMKIPAHFLQGDESQWRCYNMTDYRLPVEPGDELRLIFEHDGIAYCKKKDVCGWYEGPYQKIKETKK